MTLILISDVFLEIRREKWHQIAKFFQFNTTLNNAAAADDNNDEDKMNINEDGQFAIFTFLWKKKIFEKEKQMECNV